jgi:hypothetical protein
MDLKNENIGKLDTEIMSEVFFQFLCENYGEETTLGILKYLEIDKSDLYNKDSQSKILFLINDSCGSL